jgi:hypothetical protein
MQTTTATPANPPDETPPNNEAARVPADKQKRKRTKPPADDKERPATAQPKFQYRVKGEESKADSTPQPKDGEDRPNTTRDGKRQRKPKRTDDANPEGDEERPAKGMVYRVKGEASKNENGEEEKGADYKKEPEEKNLIYHNPFDFKETR